MYLKICTKWAIRVVNTFELTISLGGEPNYNTWYLKKEKQGTWAL